MNIVDLFCGCGGFASGAHAAGLGPRLAFDVDEILTSSFSKNFPHTRLALTDLAHVDGKSIRNLIGGNVDGVFGGPPCQAFSEIGLRREADPRRELLYHFFRIVAELRPAFFVMENVRGLGFVTARPLLDRALDCIPGHYVILGPVILDAADFGAATKRPRMFVIGYDPGRCDPISVDQLRTLRQPAASVRAAIADLRLASAYGQSDGFDLWKISSPGRPSLYSSKLRCKDGMFTGNQRTVHAPEIQSRFALIKPGTVDAIGRHPRLTWAGQCPTLRAGTGNERGSFQSVRPIHPDEPRVITVREAARLQGFKDAFRFHPTIWHSFRMIGNSVSPLVAEAIFRCIGDSFATKRQRNIPLSDEPISGLSP